MSSLEEVIDKIANSANSFICDEDDILSLADIFSKSNALDLDELNDLVGDLFPYDSNDLDYTSLLAVLSSCMLPHFDEENRMIFNPDGVVPLCEFLDSLNAIENKIGSDVIRKNSLDNISFASDFFNEGYQACVTCMSDLFFNLYRRDELILPITRIELAYITILCWSGFTSEANPVCNEDYYLGITFDWKRPANKLQKYEDGFSYNVCCSSTNTYSLNIKEYKNNKTMSEYKKSIKDGVDAIPLPMFMSLLEVFELGLLPSDSNLSPLKEVSRGELSYFLVNLAKLLYDE